MSTASSSFTVTVGWLLVSAASFWWLLSRVQ